MFNPGPKPLAICDCGVANAMPMVWHKSENHLCRFHTGCMACAYAITGLIDDVEEYLAGWNSAT